MEAIKLFFSTYKLYALAIAFALVATVAGTTGYKVGHAFAAAAAAKDEKVCATKDVDAANAAAQAERDAAQVEAKAAKDNAAEALHRATAAEALRDQYRHTAETATAAQQRTVAALAKLREENPSAKATLDSPIPDAIRDSVRASRATPSTGANR